MKGEALLVRVLAWKLDALRKLAAHLGMLGKHRRWEPSLEEHETMVWKAFGVVLDPTTHATQKAYAATLLDCLVPRWRAVVPATVLGPVMDRNSNEVQKWRKDVLDRDGRTCRICGAKHHLHAHHIAHWADVPSLRLVVANGLTLCKPCHGRVHA